MNNQPLFSVLLANYNNGTYIEETLESIYNQTYTNWEVVIVDDKSTDTSHVIYEKLNDDSRINIYYNVENKGTGYTKAKCIEMAKGEICGFVDPDDTLELDALELMTDNFIKRPNIALVHSKLQYCDEHLIKYDEYKVAKAVPKEDPFFFNFNGEITAFSAFRKAAYGKTLGLDPYYKRAVDQDLYFKLYEVGEVIFLDKFLYNYRVHKGGISSLENSPKADAWKWIVILDAARRRNLNIEDIFIENLVSKSLFNSVLEEFRNLSKEYNRLYKYKNMNEILHKINKFFRF